jgi:hypothetical protein
MSVFHEVRVAFPEHEFVTADEFVIASAPRSISAEHALPGDLMALASDTHRPNLPGSACLRQSFG